MELTHNYALILPLLAASVAAHAFTVLFQKRSILTERLSRRGYHLSREYGVDPLETVTVAEVMRTGEEASPATSVVVAYPGETLRAVAERMASAQVTELQVMDLATGKAIAVVGLEDMLHARARSYIRETKQERVRRLPMFSARTRTRTKEAEGDFESVP
jgi:hypothetical protein